MNPLYRGLDALDQCEDTETFAVRDVHQPSPERRLAVAVLGEVVEDLRRFPRGSEVYRNAVAYVMDDDTSWPYAFVPLCEALEIDPVSLREGLLAIGPGARRSAIALRQATGGYARRVVPARVFKGRRASWRKGG